MYDTIIIGSGSAGLPAGMYASRYQCKNLIIGEMPGGALATSHCVENYPGTLSATGAEIMKNFQKHAEISGSEILQDRVESVEKIGDYHFRVTTLGGKIFESHTIIIATGNTYKTLNIPGEQQFYGQGVSYCATCDGNFYKNLVVAIVGGGNTAITEALYLAEITKEVHILIRGDEIRAENIWVEKAKNTKNIIFHYNSAPKEIIGNTLGITHIITKNNEKIPVDGIFIAIGTTPITKVLDNLPIKKDEEGYIIVDKRQESSIK